VSSLRAVMRGAFAECFSPQKVERMTARPEVADVRFSLTASNEESDRLAYRRFCFQPDWVSARSSTNLPAFFAAFGL